MSTITYNTIATTHPPPTATTAGTIRFLAAERLRTSYAALRPGAPLRVPVDAAQLPIRVVPTEKGTYEVIDGFKRLNQWREQGHHLIPAVVEPPSSSEEHKRLLLLANAPPRTLTALDEARVVCSLMNEEGLSQARIARSLGHKPRWVARRVDIATRLSPTAEEKLAQGAIGPTFAHALCAVPTTEQDAVLGAVQRHGLKLREALRLLGSYRVADEPDRRELLRAPLKAVRSRSSSSPATSPTVTVLERRLHYIQEALVSLAEFSIPDELAPPEKRRLEARLHGVLAQLETTVCAHTIEQTEPNHTGDYDESEQPTEPKLCQTNPCGQAGAGQERGSTGDPTRDPAVACLLRYQRDCSAGRLVAQDRSPHFERAWLSSTAAANSNAEQTRAVPRNDRAEGQTRTHRHPDSPRDQRAGLLGRTEHSCRTCAHRAGSAGPPTTQKRQAALRNRSG